MYFTDSANAQPRPAEPLPAAFYYLPPGATKAIQILTDVRFPNGVILSRDEKVLYLNDSQGERRRWPHDRQPGHVYVAASTGVQVFSPHGQHLGTIPTPRSPQNLAFAGPDKKTLYVVGRGAVSKVQMMAEGFKDRAK